jgi:hypothetical protein
VPRLRERSATDLVVLGITGIVGLLLVLGMVAIVTIELIHPDTDTDPFIEAESEILGVLVGALVGFIGGRSTGRAETLSGDGSAPSRP